MNDAIYKKSFDLFLKRTDEKSVIKRFIDSNIILNKRMNALDIGGGDGTLAAMISEKVKSLLVVEPNINFYKQIKNKGIKIIHDKWENTHLTNTFDFILAAYVVTYFPESERKQLIEKMYKNLSHEGKILLLSVDAERGSWREIHTYFNKLINRAHRSSDKELEEVASKYRATRKTFTTQVTSKDTDEALEILGFDFYKYPSEFLKFSKELRKFLERHATDDGKIILEMVHNAYIITKK